jgi:serine protease
LDYLPGEVVVRFHDGVTVEGQQRALTGLRTIRPSVTQVRSTGRIAVVRDPTEPDSHVLAAQLRQQAEVAFAEPNYIRRRRLVPADPGYAEFQWNMRTIDMPRVWDINPGGSGELIVAVIDTGLTSATETVQIRTWNGDAIQSFDLRYATNPDISAARIVNAVDLVFWEGPVVDFEGHGTHVSGTLGEDANSLAEVGVAYGVKIMPIKACLSFWDFQFALSELGVAGSPPPDVGGCPDDAVADAIRQAADAGAEVINLSLGGFAPSEIMRDALLYAVGKGAFIAIAAGNSFEDGNPIEHPAAYAAEIDGVMSVGATGPTRSRAFYSGTASGIEIVAPGGDNRVSGLGGMVWQHTILPPDSTPGEVLFPRFDRYADTPSQGTSMATPHVAGVAALLISQGVTNPAAVEALLKATALDLGAAGRDDEYGHGLIQPRTAIRGYGIFTR